MTVTLARPRGCWWSLDPKAGRGVPGRRPTLGAFRGSGPSPAPLVPLRLLDSHPPLGLRLSSPSAGTPPALPAWPPEPVRHPGLRFHTRRCLRDLPAPCLSRGGLGSISPWTAGPLKKPPAPSLWLGQDRAEHLRKAGCTSEGAGKTARDGAYQERLLGGGGRGGGHAGARKRGPSRVPVGGGVGLGVLLGED